MDNGEKSERERILKAQEKEKDKDADGYFCVRREYEVREDEQVGIMGFATKLEEEEDIAEADRKVCG